MQPKFPETVLAKSTLTEVSWFHVFCCSWLNMLVERSSDGYILYVSAEPASPNLDSEATMEVDNCDVNSDGGHSMDEQDELSTPEDKLFFEGSCTDGEKDDETLRAIR